MGFLTTGGIIRSMPDRLGVDFTGAVAKNTTKKSSGSSKKKKESSAPATVEPKYSNEQLIGDYTKLFFEQYQPKKMTYTQRSAEQIAGEIGAWLRPTYDAAIRERKEQTESYRAELDADAIARGMGASSYVTDVKARQMAKEAADIRTLETDYAAALAKQMSAALDTERQRSYEADLFNAEADRAAYDKAYSMALSLLEAYRAGDAGAKNLTASMYA